jgi:AraC-like DNA-binding protein
MPPSDMTEDALLSALDLLLRGGGCVLLLLIAALLARDYRRALAARLGALFALGAAAYVLCSAPGLDSLLGLWATPILALATGNNVVFWLFAQALFDDAFRFRWWHPVLWASIVAIGLLCGFLLEPENAAAAAPVRSFLTLQAIAFAALAGAQTLGSWRDDLLERRRRLRLFIVTAAAGYTVATALSGLLRGAPAPLAVSALHAGALLAIAAVVAWSVLRIPDDEALFSHASDEPSVAAAAISPRIVRLDATDRHLVAALEHVMTVERTYRQEGLTIGKLAQGQGLPEYKLRRLINQGLGYRNFNAFLNHYRIADAKAALADQSQSAVPVLTIALDAGFNSLGPFNRAFKAETGLTPSEYRRLTGAGGSAARSADFEISQRIPITAGQTSNSA